MIRKGLCIILSAILLLCAVPTVAAEETDSPQTEPAPAETLTEAAEPPTEAQTAPEAPTEAEPDPTTAEKPAAQLADTAGPSYPMVISAVPSEHGVTIKWKAYNNAASYIVYAREDDGTVSILGSTSALTFEHRISPDGTPYRYAVRAFNANGRAIGNFDNEGYLFACLKTPALTGIENVAGGQKISWESVSGAPMYRIYIKKNGNWYKLADTTSTSYINRSVSPLRLYTYTVRCLDKTCRQPLSNRDSKGISATYFAAPRVSSFTPGNGSVTVYRNSVKGVSRYAFFVKKSGKWVRLCITEKTSYTHKGLTDNTTYQYTVRAVNKNGKYCSGYYADGGSFCYIAPLKITKVKASGKKTVLSWTSNKNIASYRVDRKPFRGKWSTIKVTTKASFTDSSANENTPYAYSVCGLDKNGSKLTVNYYNNLYYSKGALANGKYKVGGGTFSFSKGKLVPGYYTVNNRQYYFNADGSIRKNGIVGSKKNGYTYADKNGVCCTSKEIRLAADYLMTCCTGKTAEDKMKSGFMYMAKNYPYQRVYNDSPTSHNVGSYAIELFSTKRGTCYRYAAGFACLARLCGYRVRFVNGIVAESAPHGWTEVYYKGRWRICDPDYQLPGYGLPDYGAYMMNSHDWTIRVYWKSELVIKDGKAVWK